ncbi:M20 family metallopeptidase [Agromyces silvae]|uniref:M20 family metallopeptidase n=1 Tax=Agromyces silvae TaxID=3388266 RepID=UPI00280C03C5|nr:M20/M25/M40 family metallo-hydrolase [Agromyces protaetiae]
MIAAGGTRTAEIADLLSASIRCSSISGDEAGYASYLRAWCEARGWHTETQPVPDEPGARARWNLLARPFARAGRPLLVINGHLDVVPVGDADAWSGEPFDGRVEHGYVHGRGAVDTKGPIVSALLAADVLTRSSAELAVDLELHLVVGEEGDGVGTRTALRSGERPAMAIVLEPSGNELVTASTGVLAFEITAHGVTAHSSKPWEGRDALAHLLAIRGALSEREEARRAAFAVEGFAAVPDPLPFVVGAVQAGDYPMAVPALARMSGRIGLSIDADIDAERAALVELVARVDREHGSPVASDVRVLHALSGWWTSPASPLVAAFQDLPTLVLTAGSDAGYYGVSGVDTVLFGPGELELAHGPDERILISEVERASEILATAIASIGKEPRS